MSALRPRAARADRAGRPNPRTTLVALCAVLSLAAMVLLAVLKLDLSAATGALGHASPVWVLVAVAAVAVACGARAEGWAALLDATLGRGRISRGTAARALVIGMAASTVAPARAGEAVRSLMVARRGGERTLPAVVGTVLAQTVLNVLALLGLAVVVVLSGAGSSLHASSIAVAVGLPIGVAAVIAVGMRLWRRSRCAARRAAGPVGRAGCWMGRQLDGAGRGVAILARPRVLLHAGLAQLAAWALQCLACWATMLALHLGPHATPAAAAAVLLAINLAAVVPVTPGNVGLFQAACIAVLTPLGVSAGHALAYGLLLQAIEIAVALGLGLPAAIREGLSAVDLGELVTRSPNVALAAG